MQDTPPKSWSNPELLARTITLETTVLRALTIHGAMVLATKHPLMGRRFTKAVLEDMLDHLEAMFEEMGLEKPACGWRGLTSP